MLKRIALTLGILLAALVLAAGVYYFHGRSSLPLPAPGVPPDLVSQLPGEATTVIHINLAAIRATPFAEKLESLLPPPAPDPDYKKFIRDTGFDYEKDLDRVAIALWPAPGRAQGPAIVALADGRFDWKKVSAYVLRIGKLVHHDPSDVYEIASTGRSGNIAIALLTPGRIALAENAPIDPVLKPVASSRLNPALQEKIRGVAGGEFFAVARTENLPRDLGIELSRQAQLNRLLSSIRTLTLSGQPKDEKYQIAVDADCDAAVNAVHLATLLDMLRILGRAALANPNTRRQIEPQALPVLDALLGVTTVTHDGPAVHLRLALTPEMLGGFARPVRSSRPASTGRLP